MLSVPCDLGTYRSMGKHSVAPVLILGWGGGESITLVFILAVCAVTQVLIHGEGSLSLGSSSWDWP